MKKGNSKLKIKTGILIIGIVLLILTVSVLGRFVYLKGKDRYLTSKSFYFSSDVLKSVAPTYTYTNWSGTDTYKIDIELYSFENELRKLSEDIEFKATCTGYDSSKIKCSIDSQDGETIKTGTIYASNNKSSFSVYISPVAGATIQDGDEFNITVSAYTETPYSKTLSANYKLKVETLGVGYEVKDEASRSYLELSLKNTLDADIDTTVEFNPSVVRLDMNDEAYIQNKGIETQTLDGSHYVKKVIFTMKGESSKNIKFYKVDYQQNYTGQTNLFTVTK